MAFELRRRGFSRFGSAQQLDIKVAGVQGTVINGHCTENSGLRYSAILYRCTLRLFPQCYFQIEVIVTFSAFVS